MCVNVLFCGNRDWETKKRERKKLGNSIFQFKTMKISEVFLWTYELIVCQVLILRPMVLFPFVLASFMSVLHV